MDNKKSPPSSSKNSLKNLNSSILTLNDQINMMGDQNTVILEAIKELQKTVEEIVGEEKPLFEKKV